MTDAEILGLWDRWGGEIKRWGTILFVVLAHPRSHGRFEMGFLFLLGGLFARWWAAGQPRPTSGFSREFPYGMVRHPDLCGVIMAAAGTALACISFSHIISSILICIAGAALCIGLLPALVRRREEAWRIEMPNEFASYQSEVPPLFPRIQFDPTANQRMWPSLVAIHRWEPTRPFKLGLHKELGVVLLVATFLRFKMIYGL